MIQLAFKRFIYKLLFNLPRAILDLLVTILSIATLCWYNPSFNYYKLIEHSKWADKIAKKYSGVQKYIDK